MKHSKIERSVIDHLSNLFRGKGMDENMVAEYFRPTSGHDPSDADWLRGALEWDDADKRDLSGWFFPDDYEARGEAAVKAFATVEDCAEFLKACRDHITQVAEREDEELDQTRMLNAALDDLVKHYVVGGIQDKAQEILDQLTDGNEEDAGAGCRI